MQDENDQTETPDTPPAVKWSWLYFLSILVAGTSGWFRLIAAMLDDVEVSMDSHVEHKRSREEFAKRAGLEIEALTKAPSVG